MTPKITYRPMTDREIGDLLRWQLMRDAVKAFRPSTYHFYVWNRNNHLSMADKNLDTINTLS